MGCQRATYQPCWFLVLRIDLLADNLSPPGPFEELQGVADVGLAEDVAPAGATEVFPWQNAGRLVMGMSRNAKQTLVKSWAIKNTPAQYHTITFCDTLLVHTMPRVPWSSIPTGNLKNGRPQGYINVGHHHWLVDPHES